MAYVFQLLVHMAELEPDILLRQRRRRNMGDVLEALQKPTCQRNSSRIGRYWDLHVATYLKTALELALLLVDYAQAEVNLCRLLIVGLILHHLGKGLLGVFKRTMAIVEYTDPVPQLRILDAY